MSDDGRRVLVVPAKNELEATYKVAVLYSVQHVFRAVPAEGEKLFEVVITAREKK